MKDPLKVIQGFLSHTVVRFGGDSPDHEWKPSEAGRALLALTAEMKRLRADNADLLKSNRAMLDTIRAQAEGFTLAYDALKAVNNREVTP